MFTDADLWVDPLQDDPAMGTGSVLLAEDIIRYIEEHNILINQQDFKEGDAFGAKMKGASYTMSPHAADAHMFVEGGLQVLQTVTDPKRPYYVVPRNSLVFVKLRQELRVPYYMIGRHNLKIDYVYQGLLLGTGPQVDPGYVGNLIIPLHNLTTNEVKLYLNESFVSIDFVRTTRLRLNGVQPSDRNNLYAHYGESKHLLDLRKITKRRDLRDYLPPGHEPQSALGGVLRQYDQTLIQLTEAKERLEGLETRTAGVLDRYESEYKEVVSDQKASALRLEEKLAEYGRAHRIEVWAIAAILITMALAQVGTTVAVVQWVRDYQGDTLAIISDTQQRVERARQDARNDAEQRLTSLEKRVEELSVSNSQKKTETKANNQGRTK